MSEAVARGAVPDIVGDLAGWLPRLPPAVFLTHRVRWLARQRPELFERLATYVPVALLIDPSDLPIRFRLWLAGSRSRVDVIGDHEPADAAARVRAPVLILLGLLDGTYDADALFFSRDLVIEGDTEVVLALRNAIEDADLSPAELLGLAGPPGRLLNRAADSALALLRQRLGAPAAALPTERGWP